MIGTGSAMCSVATRRPHPVLRRYVGYRMAGFPPGLHRGLPARHLTFIVSIAGPVETVAVPDGSPPPPLQALVGGLQAGPTVLRHDGDQAGVAVEVTPMGARSLFGLPAV